MIGCQGPFEVTTQTAMIIVGAQLIPLFGSISAGASAHHGPATMRQFVATYTLAQKVGAVILATMLFVGPRPSQMHFTNTRIGFSLIFQPLCLIFTALRIVLVALIAIFAHCCQYLVAVGSIVITVILCSQKARLAFFAASIWRTFAGIEIVQGFFNATPIAAFCGIIEAHRKLLSGVVPRAFAALRGFVIPEL